MEDVCETQIDFHDGKKVEIPFIKVFGYAYPIENFDVIISDESKIVKFDRSIYLKEKKNWFDTE